LEGGSGEGKQEREAYAEQEFHYINNVKSQVAGEKIW